MRHYRCCFVQKDGTPAVWRMFQSESDEEAYDRALGLSVGYPYTDKIEVCDNSRLTFSYNRSAVQTAVELGRLVYLAMAAAKKETELEFKNTIASLALALAQEAEELERRERDDSINVRHKT